MGCGAFVLFVVIAFSIPNFIAAITWHVAPGFCFFTSPKYADDRLCEALEARTNVAAVLSEARVLIEAQRAAEAKGGERATMLNPSDEPPPAIKAVRGYVSVGPESLGIECGGGFFHFGLAITPGHDKTPVWGQNIAWKRLGEGVWLYRDDAWRLK